MTPVGRIPGSPNGTARVPRPDDLARLTKTSKQLEGLFVQQMFAAMRSTVPEDGAMAGGAGEEIFTSLFDQQLADRLPEQWQHGIGESIVAKLKHRLASPEPAPAEDSTKTPRITSPEHR